MLLSQPGVLGVQDRNAIIQARLSEIDILYYRYENRITNEIRTNNYGANVVQMALGGAGALTTGDVSRTLSAVSAFATGVKVSYDRDLLLDQSMQAFIAQMRANRASIKSKIVSRMSADAGSYTLQAAVSDLAEYQQAGTLAAGLSGITQSAQVQEQFASSELKTVENRVIFRREPASPSKIAVRIRDWIRGGASEAERVLRNKQAKQCFEAAEKPDDLTEFAPFLIRSEKYPKTEKAVVACLSTKFNVKF